MIPVEDPKYLGKREFHGALAKHSPYEIRSTLCVCCGRRFTNACFILDEICNDCFRLGWRPPDEYRFDEEPRLWLTVNLDPFAK